MNEKSFAVLHNHVHLSPLSLSLSLQDTNGVYCLCPQCSSKSPDGQLLLLLLLLLLFSFMLVTSEHSHLLYLFLQSLVYNTTGNFDIP